MIDRVGILGATFFGMVCAAKAVTGLMDAAGLPRPVHALVDGNLLPQDMPCQPPHWLKAIVYPYQSRRRQLSPKQLVTAIWTSFMRPIRPMAGTAIWAMAPRHIRPGWHRMALPPTTAAASSRFKRYWADSELPRHTPKKPKMS